MQMEPPANAVDIGSGHKISFAEYQGEVAGITDWHRKPDGAWCCGWVAFKGSKWEKGFPQGIAAWNVTQREPLTLSPSLLCRACGDHGFITNGRWIKA
jgi:hypothetical protein